MHTEGLSHCERLLRHEEPAFLPSGETLRQKISSLRTSAMHSIIDQSLVAAFGQQVDACSMGAFSGSHHAVHGGIRILHAGIGDLGYTIEPLDVGMIVIYVNRHTLYGISPTALPIRVGRILRLVRESDKIYPYALIESWWPLLKPSKHGDGQINMYGTWIPCNEPITVEGNKKKQSKVDRSGGPQLVEIHDVIVWPIELDAGSDSFQAGGRIPFTALHHARSTGKVDILLSRFIFTKRGNDFYMEVVKRVAATVRDSKQ